MDQADVIFCKLCLKCIIDKKFQALGEIPLEVLSVLSLNVNLDEKDSYMCNDCSIELFAAFDFKTMCLDTEYSLVPYGDSENALQIDLKHIYLKVQEGEYATATSYQQVCRLCLGIVDEGFMSLKKLCDAEMLNKYIPEVNFNITKDPVVCKQCWNSLDIHIDFLRRWTCTEQKMKIEAQDPEGNLCIKSEETDLKFEEPHEDEALALYKSNENILKDETIPESYTSSSQEALTSSFDGAQKNYTALYNPNDTEMICKEGDCKTSCKSKRNTSKVSMYRCDTCSFETKYKSSFKNHLLKHMDLSGVPMYKCDNCNYETRWKGCLFRHQLMHKELLELQMYKCNECDYQSRWLGSFRNHQMIHKDPSKRQLHKCEKCNFETRWEFCLKRHQVKHENSSDVQMYQCKNCDFKTIWRPSIKKHQIIHESSSDVQMYKCNECDYQTKWKNCLKGHRVIHETSPEMYKCNECDFQNKRKLTVQRHQIMHKDPLQIQMYKCEKCSYETREKGNLKKHLVVHESTSKAQMYKCKMCDFETKWKRSIERHLITHETLSETKMYKCKKCDFQVKSKWDLKVHEVRHERSSEVYRYKCGECDFRTKIEAGLVKHRTMHRAR